MPPQVKEPQRVFVKESPILLASDKMWVTQECKTIFTKAVNDAKEVFNNGDATNAQCEGALYRLAQAYGGRTGDRFSWLENTYFGKGDDYGCGEAFDTGYNGTGFWTFAQAHYGTGSNYTEELTVLLSQAGDFDPTIDTNDGIYMASITDQYFDGGVEVGLEAFLEAGKVYINGIQVPADEATYCMNGMPAIWQKENGDWTWQAHDKLNADNEAKIPHNGDYSFEFARRRFILAVSALRGMTTTIWAEDGESAACRVDFSIKSGGQVEKIIVNDDGTTTVWGVPIDATSYNTDGGPNDIEPRTLPTRSFDQSIEEGDTVLYWYDNDGWHMERAVPVQGIMTASDHFNINVNGSKYSDALIVRYNMQAGSRPSQFISAANNLHLNDIPVTLWNTDTGYVIGISRMEYARTGLQAGVKNLCYRYDTVQHVRYRTGGA